MKTTTQDVFTNRICSVLATIAIFLSAAHSASAGSTWWDPEGSPASTGSTLIGTWENTSWSATSTATASPISWVPGNAAFFTVGSGNADTYTVTMNAVENVGGLANGTGFGVTVAFGNITITGASGGIDLNTGAAAGFASASGGLTYIEVPISGLSTSPIVFEGAGQFFFDNSGNSYAGATELGESAAAWTGTVNFNNGNSFGGSGGGPIIMSSSGSTLAAEVSGITLPNTVNAVAGTLNVVGGAAGGGGLTFSGAWTLGTGTLNLALGGSGNLVTIQGGISGSGGLSVSGSGNTLALNTAAGSYTGITAVTSGTLLLGSGGPINSSTSFTIGAGATFDVSVLDPYTFPSSSTTLNASGIGTGASAAIIKDTGSTGVNLGTQVLALTFTPAAFSGTDTSHPSLDVAGPGTLTLNGNTVQVINGAGTALGVGTYTLIEANAISGSLSTAPVFVGGTGLSTAGNGVEAGASVSGSTVVLTVAAASQLTTTTLAAPNPIASVATTTFTATVSPDPSGDANGGGTVQFYLSGVPLGSPVTVPAGGVVTSPSTTTLPVGSYTVQAIYSGSGTTVPDFQYSASSSAVANQLVQTWLWFDNSTSGEGWTTTTTAWSSSPSGGSDHGWVDGSYAVFPSSANPDSAHGSITMSGTEQDTAGITVTTAYTGSSLSLSGGSETQTLGLDSGTTQPGYCVFNVNGSHTLGVDIKVFSKTPNTTGLWITGDGTSGVFMENSANAYTGGTVIATGGSVTAYNATALGTGRITLAGGLLKANTTVLTFANTIPVTLSGNTVLGTEGASPITFDGLATLSGAATCTLGNINVAFSGVMSGSGSLTGINYVSASSSQEGTLILNASSPNTYTGGTTVSFNPSIGGSGTPAFTLDANTAGSLGYGPVTVNAGATLQIDNLNAMAPGASLYVVTGSTVNLTYSTAQNMNVGALYINGIQQTYGVYGNGATDPNSIFTGSGLINVASPMAITSESVSGNQFTVCWASVPGASYDVMTNINLAPPQSWSVVNGTPIPAAATGNTTCYTLPGTVSGNPQVYVIVRAP